MGRLGKLFESIEGALKETRSFLEYVSNEQKDIDQKQNSIESILNNNSTQGLSARQIEQLAEASDEEGQEIEDEVQKMEEAIQDHMQLLESLEKFEQLLGSEERQTHQKLEKVKQEIRSFNQKVNIRSVDRAITDLESAVGEMGEEAEEILAAAQMISEVEQESWTELQLENHLEEEVERFSRELDTIEEALKLVDDRKAQKQISKVEEMREKIKNQVRTENRQLKKEVGEEKDVVEKIRHEAKNYSSMLREAYEEAQTLENNFNGQEWGDEEKELSKIVNEIEREKEKADKASKEIQKDASFFSKASKFFS